MVAADKPRFVRQFALTQGRARSIGTDLPLEVQVQATARGMTRARRHGLTEEQASIVQLCASALSIAEISAHLHIHLGVARVIVSDMAEVGLVAVTVPDVGADGPDLPTLERLLDDLQAL